MCEAYLDINSKWLMFFNLSFYFSQIISRSNWSEIKKIMSLIGLIMIGQEWWMKLRPYNLSTLLPVDLIFLAYYFSILVSTLIRPYFNTCRPFCLFSVEPISFFVDLNACQSYYLSNLSSLLSRPYFHPSYSFPLRSLWV